MKKKTPSGKILISIQKLSDLLMAFDETQTLLALIANDPSDPQNGEKAAQQFNRNKTLLGIGGTFKAKH